MRQEQRSKSHWLVRTWRAGLVFAALPLAGCGTGCPAGTKGGCGASPMLALVAGRPGGQGNVDGSGPSARFQAPRAIALDGQGNAFVLDSSALRRISGSGEVRTLAGSASDHGYRDDAGPAARFNLSPMGIAADRGGHLFVSDTYNSAIRKIATDGGVTTFAGAPDRSGRHDDGDGAAVASFALPIGVATDAAGDVYVADRGNNLIRKITPFGQVSTVAGSPGTSGHRDGAGADAYFKEPFAVAVDDSGDVLVADVGDFTIRKVAPDGQVSTISGVPDESGSNDGAPGLARFQSPAAIAAGHSGDLVVADQHAIRRVTADGTVSTLAGRPNTACNVDGVGPDACFNEPAGLAIDAQGVIYVADRGNASIRKVTPQGEVSTWAGAGPAPGANDGHGAAARFSLPTGIAADASGVLYVADGLNDVIRRVSPDGDVVTLAGAAGQRGALDGDGTLARFSGPAGMAADAAGNVYVVDHGSHSIRKISATGLVTTLAGTPGQPGHVDGPGAVASFNAPEGIVSDTSGRLYVTDTGNHTVRVIDASGVVSTLAGEAGVSGAADGAGAIARFSRPTGIVIDTFGTLYVADTANHTIRKVSPTGSVTTLAGTAGARGVEDGDAASARFDEPSSLALDGLFTLYVGDARNATIRKIDATGRVSTVVGSTQASGFTPGPLPGVIDTVGGLALSGGKLFFTMPYQNAVGMVTSLP
jgi:sugar lactone lactonase YvrE